MSKIRMYIKSDTWKCNNFIDELRELKPFFLLLNSLNWREWYDGSTKETSWEIVPLNVCDSIVMRYFVSFIV